MIRKKVQKLTPTLAEFLFRTHWQFLAMEEYNSRDQHIRFDYKEEIAIILAEHFNLSDYCIRNDCFLCEFLTRPWKDLPCKYCPVEWSMQDVFKTLCENPDTLYYKWTRTKSWKVAAFCAMKISQLPFERKI